MKIGFYYLGYRMSRGNGIVSQALTWKEGLEALGHSVELLNCWEVYNLGSFDAIHIFGFNENLVDFLMVVSKQNRNIFFSPILDPDYSLFKAWCMSRYGSFSIRLTNRYSALRESSRYVKCVLARSEFEKQYLVKSFGFSECQCSVVRLPSGFPFCFNQEQKEPFCFHMSLLCDERKNVKRLIDASIKYNFKLVLAGGLRNEKEKKILNGWISGHQNITYKGYISDLEKENLYKKARVFALPSINEGVGLVALEAASYGADIVITNLGGPKEYYSNLAAIIDPYDVDAIGMAVKDFIDNKKTYQPELGHYLDKNYSLSVISSLLVSIYSQN